MLAAWLYRLKLQKVICLISCILLESPPISASFARQIIPLSETNNSWALWKIDGWKDKTKSFPFGMGPGSPIFFQFQFQVEKNHSWIPSQPQPTGASTLAKSSAGSAGPPVKVSPVMGSSASQKTSWMDGTPWEKDGSVREVHPPPPEVEQLAPLPKWWFKDVPLLLGRPIYRGYIGLWGCTWKSTLSIHLSSEKIGSPPKFRCRWLWEEG